MKPRPRGLEREHAEQFDDPAVVAAYHARPAYPEAAIALLRDRVIAPASHILDLGCGPGELARRIAPHVRAVTAVDRSARMIERARALAGKDRANLTWIVGRVEDVSLRGPFSCALAAESFHWFDWDSLVPRLLDWLPTSQLILVDRVERAAEWSGALKALIAEHSTNRDFEPYDLVDELTSRRCLSVDGRSIVGPHPIRQSIEHYIESIHSRNGFSRDRMPRAAARHFDDAVRRALAPHASAGCVEFSIDVPITWGRVVAPA